MAKRKSYEMLPFLPNLIGETVATTPYTGVEISLQHRSQRQVEETEAKRRAMSLDQIREFSDLCDQRCKVAYEAKADWFEKCVNAVGSRGRDQLYVWLSHWLAAYLNNPESFRRHSASKRGTSHLLAQSDVR